MSRMTVPGVDVARMEYAWWDADGNPVDDAKDAVGGEATEHDADGEVLRRHYLVAGPAPAEPPGLRDDWYLDPENTDSTKGTWDLWWHGEDGTEPLRPVDTLAGLRSVLGANVGREQIADQLVLPYWQAAPENLKREVSEWLIATRPA